MTTSIRHIAKLAGTSVSSVSRVLNNSGYASPELRERVEAAIRTLNYTPSKGARMLRGAPSRMIGLMLPSIDVPFFGILAHAIEQELFRRGYQTLICSTAENMDHEARYISMLLSQRVDGVIVASAFGSTEHFEALREAHIPIVAIDRELPGIAGEAVMADHEEGGRLMARHLIELGHRAIGIVGAPAHSQPVQLRLLGITAEMAGNGMAPAAIAMAEEHSFAATYPLARELLASRPELTAIIGTTDISAIAAIHAVQDHGFSVPRDYSVIGFDDLPEAAYVFPRLTTIAQPIRGVGEQAVRRLEALIDEDQVDGEPRMDSLIKVPVTLIRRDSTGLVRT
ncbi:LacI family transcriptional regulator [Rhizobium sp. ERR 922]|uniref:LacI family transcriptional regulator n=1 Tax=Rhizobium dioscoreae TaxID=2653122 RepID=A0ABQ0Z0S7_9HYPH|nr:MULTISPECIES: LacI family DNA-binding transcriptional regulator [Rhizobium]MCZ3376854.1 LacI family DNA-binding transcriptional regulator [Rhizobium sp. AG207R]TWB11327.1 LacI family transcriptional regulator [Rhizobium sp. ERR1071]TWB58395.1 LacI family transcriptional regulator [Rhizobium sp. ERR 922]TWC00091.1 LacI family transcriptional regulator [Rhizobium sp. ERR 942]GES43725.1 LacI family transcriptional regulator [Rhizobium dioscoreae]